MASSSHISTLLEGGWGRAAVSRFTKSQEEIRAEVIKALEGKIAVEFKDYSQWQRVPVPQPTTAIKKVPYKSPKKQPSTRPLTGVSGTSCSTLCIHPWNKKPQVVDRTAENEAKDRTAILKLLIEAKQKSANQYEALCGDLERQNKALRKEIDQVSSVAHKKVTELLEKYENYSGATLAIRKNHAKDQIRARTDLAMTSDQLRHELECLEQEVLDLDTKLRDFQQDLQVLRTYKDKEYPVKAMQISRLGKNLDELAFQQKAERGEIERVTNGEAMKLRLQHEERLRNIMEDAAEEAFSTTVSAGIQHMAWHNNLLRHEIEEHKQGIREQEVAVHHLQLEITELKQMPESHVRTSVFPEVFLKKKICDPEEDVILDIPTQQPLPV